MNHVNHFAVTSAQGPGVVSVIVLHVHYVIVFREWILVVSVVSLAVFTIS